MRYIQKAVEELKLFTRIRSDKGREWATFHFSMHLLFIMSQPSFSGYGTDAPDSYVGRVFCLVYLFFGIPLYLITLADLAKFCTEFMNKLYIDIIKYKHRVRRKYRRWKSGRQRRDSVKVGQLIIAGGEDEVSACATVEMVREKRTLVGGRVSVDPSGARTVRRSPFSAHHRSKSVLKEFMSFNSLFDCFYKTEITGILLVYIAIASYIIAAIEGWPLSDGFYFVMISVLTIGFGDLVPRNETFILIVLLLILIGLVLTTTCVDIVGAYYIDRLHFFGRRLDDDPLSWLKEVQQRRIEAMKREAMRKLFETVTALHHIRFTDPPESPRNLTASHATADSVLLRWNAPIYVDEGKRYWYTLTYKPRKTNAQQILNDHFGYTPSASALLADIVAGDLLICRTPQRRNQVVRVDFINEEKYLVTGLKSFTLYEFSLTTTTRYGSSKPARAQEYTEPCTVPQNLRLEAISCETATVSWRAPKMNNGPERYVIQYTQEPAPQFRYWSRYKVGENTRFTLTDLLPDTRYILCVSAEHNYGLAAMSKSIRFRTKRWWADDDSACLQLPFTNHRLSIASVLSSLSALR
ncbi:fibronectin type III domain protein [Ancylostoma ceylanicum]|uniref:Fibronectin type III domain protein n=1 Tax=Ancylostoma ceylanicum TaxID=53326 RepID=A0A0D6LRZ6_9BILA|nr:fibronectin type III domain protein [Ancylostoma ceylanicum]